MRPPLGSCAAARSFCEVWLQPFAEITHLDVIHRKWRWWRGQHATSAPRNFEDSRLYYTGSMAYYRPSVELLPAEESRVRAQLLSAFVDIASSRGGPHSRVIHASDFQRVLDGMGLKFGHEYVDRVMLLCVIDSGGMVRCPLLSHFL